MTQSNLTATYEAVLETSPDCLKVLDLEGRLMYMNYNGQCLMEIEDFEKLRGNYWWDLWLEESREVVRRSVDAALKGEPVQFTAFCPTAKNTPKWWSVTVTPIKDKHNRVIEIISSSRDITPIKSYEEELKLAEEKLKTGLQVANIGLAEIDYPTNTAKLTPEAAELFGYPYEEITLSREELHQCFTPSFKEYIAKKIEELLLPPPLADVKSLELEHPITLPSGGVRWLRVNKRVFFKQTEQGKTPIYSILAAQDITQRKEHEHRLEENEAEFRTIANFIPQLAWSMHPDGNIYWYNDRWYDYSGTTFEEMKGSGWKSIHHPSMLSRVEKKFESAIQHGTDWEDTFLLRSKSGDYRWFLSRATPIRDAEGNITRWFGTNTDISNEKVVQDELNRINNTLEAKVQARTEELVEKNKTLEELNAELSSFNFVASHDLQEPLRKIQLFSSRIQRSEALPEPLKPDFEKIVKSANRMQVLLKDILQFSVADTQQFEAVPVDLNEVVAEAKEVLSERIAEKQAQFTVSALPEVKGIYNLLLNVFVNIISNAIKYSKAGHSPQIAIVHSVVRSSEMAGVGISDTHSTYHRIAISDNGIGFEPKYATKIFDIFERLHTADVYEGTGIGLAICKRVITKHKGHIAAQSEPGVGSTFTIYLPAV